jgi:hypothetical protein
MYTETLLRKDSRAELAEGEVSDLEKALGSRFRMDGILKACFLESVFLSGGGKSDFSLRVLARLYMCCSYVLYNFKLSKPDRYMTAP